MKTYSICSADPERRTTERRARGSHSE